MKLRKTFKHEFVEYVPEVLAEGVLYVSIPYRTAVHLCACGCHTEVATPLSRADWQLTYDGESVTLYPSIGNWSLPCRSHYWIRNDRVVSAPQWTDKEINQAQQHDRLAVEARFQADVKGPASLSSSGVSDPEAPKSVWKRIRDAFAKL